MRWDDVSHQWLSQNLLLTPPTENLMNQRTYDTPSWWLSLIQIFLSFKYSHSCLFTLKSMCHYLVINVLRDFDNFHLLGSEFFPFLHLHLFWTIWQAWIHKTFEGMKWLVQVLKDTFTCYLFLWSRGCLGDIYIYLEGGWLVLLFVLFHWLYGVALIFLVLYSLLAPFV